MPEDIKSLPISNAFTPNGKYYNKLVTSGTFVKIKKKSFYQGQYYPIYIQPFHLQA